MSLYERKRDLNTKFITLYTKFQFDFNFQINLQKTAKTEQRQQLNHNKYRLALTKIVCDCVWHKTRMLKLCEFFFLLGCLSATLNENSVIGWLLCRILMHAALFRSLHCHFMRLTSCQITSQRYCMQINFAKCFCFVYILLRSYFIDDKRINIFISRNEMEWNLQFLLSLKFNNRKNHNGTQQQQNYWISFNQ